MRERTTSFDRPIAAACCVWSLSGSARGASGMMTSLIALTQHGQRAVPALKSKVVYVGAQDLRRSATR